MPINRGYSVRNGKWFLFVNSVSNLCIGVMFTFCLFSFCVNTYFLFPPFFDANSCIIALDWFLPPFLLYLPCKSKCLKR